VISGRARRVYEEGLAAYCFGEAVCWPSQATLARDLGLSRWQVNRAVRELVAAGWVEVVEQRVGRRGWRHNVYALLEGWRPVADRVRRRIVERARRRNTNPKGLGRRPRPSGAPLGLVVAQSRPRRAVLLC
jgi:DNA-binding transcriptional MocR family regulator